MGRPHLGLAFRPEQSGNKQEVLQPFDPAAYGCSCKNMLPSIGRSTERWSDVLTQMGTERALSQLRTQDKGYSALCSYLAFQLIKGLVLMVPTDNNVVS